MATPCSLRWETQRQWSDKAVARTTPALLGLYSLVALWADGLRATRGLAPRSAGWYAKRQVTFSDALAVVRRTLWAEAAFGTSSGDEQVVETSRAALDLLTDLACYAA